MEIDAFLRRLVVVWANLQRASGAEGFSGLGKFDGLGGGIRPGACDHLTATRDEFHREAGHLEVFVGV